ncbi:hypothetical protein DFR50_1422 [Roseiarcus fermentans]|uniref:Uncharacterized protein n=1 Tax=Roseiarcus fermentans TaxID=1473586 RepID=A0A366EQJ7_9HYPH|nr:hypothetical protein [Roseiarcus fermentans]RBP03755.1 hypothetical protein DFR50_1422 [Roseiarcus fermentans]
MAHQTSTTSGPAARREADARDEAAKPEREHGMSRNREPRRNPVLPHEGEREKTQPYSREVEDYSGQGVTKPPRDQSDDARPPADPSS